MEAALAAESGDATVPSETAPAEDIDNNNKDDASADLDGEQDTVVWSLQCIINDSLQSILNIVDTFWFKKIYCCSLGNTFMWIIKKKCQGLPTFASSSEQYLRISLTG